MTVDINPFVKKEKGNLIFKWKLKPTKSASFEEHSKNLCRHSNKEARAFSGNACNIYEISASF